MQTTYTLPNGGAFKLTTAKYYLPGGECIHKTGITPDCVVELPDGKTSRDADMTDEQDTQLQRLLSFLKSNLRPVRFGIICVLKNDGLPIKTLYAKLYPCYNQFAEPREYAQNAVFSGKALQK